MSRLAKKSIQIPSGVTLTVSPENDIVVKGSKGTLNKSFSKDIVIKVENSEIVIERKNNVKKTKAIHGSSVVLLKNMLTGVSAGFEKELEAVGVGYRFAMKGKDLEVSLGFSHPIVYKTPKDITISVVGQSGVKIAGPNKEIVGQVAAEIREFRGPEPYKGKGVKYKGEIILRKDGKAGKAAA